jgi:nicotinamidase/pyrazinamidase
MMQLSDALLVIDVQNDFIPGGRLAVPDGGAIVPIINTLAKHFAHVVLTQDWHPPGHASFASSHPGAELFATLPMPYGPQILWPDHCVQGHSGADLVDSLRIPHAMMVLRKGWHQDVDSYSAFNEADGRPTGLAGYLREHGIARVFLAGLATDFCVAFSAVDAARAGFQTLVIEDACRGINTNGSVEAAWTRMAAAGVVRVGSLFEAEETKPIKQDNPRLVARGVASMAK